VAQFSLLAFGVEALEMDETRYLHAHITMATKFPVVTA
jgi:hypothetical protein